MRLPQVIRTLVDNMDDKFFHLTCHVDQAVKQKIELGQFVDLDCLLPRTKMQIMNDEQRMHFVNMDGATYWVPVDRENKITGIRWWDQAFRVYAAIYCKANPARSGEIWQYIYIINSAAASYNWENVAYYDFTFRQLMSEKPNRNWGKIYNQLWNLAMCDPLVKSHQQGNHNAGGDKVVVVTVPLKERPTGMTDAAGNTIGMLSAESGAVILTTDVIIAGLGITVLMNVLRKRQLDPPCTQQIEKIPRVGRADVGERNRQSNTAFIY